MSDGGIITQRRRTDAGGGSCDLFLFFDFHWNLECIIQITFLDTAAKIAFSEAEVGNNVSGDRSIKVTAEYAVHQSHHCHRRLVDPFFAE